MTYNKGDKVFLVMSNAELNTVKELQEFDRQWHTVALKHDVGYGDRGRWYFGSIYQLENVKSKAGLPFWFTAEHLHTMSNML